MTDKSPDQHYENPSASTAGEDKPHVKAGYSAWFVCIMAVLCVIGGFVGQSFDVIMFSLPLFLVAFLVGLVIYFASRRKDRSALFAAFASLVLGAGSFMVVIYLLNEALSKS